MFGGRSGTLKGDVPKTNICWLEYYLEFLTPETVKLLGSTKSKITKNENCENVPHLEITEVVLIHCHVVNYDYQHNSTVLHTFNPNKSYGQLLDILPSKFIF